MLNSYFTPIFSHLKFLFSYFFDLGSRLTPCHCQDLAGVPPRMGYPPHHPDLAGGTPHHPDLAGVTPPDLGWGTPPPSRPEWGNTPPPRPEMGYPSPRNVNRQIPVKTVPSHHTTYAGGKNKLSNNHQYFVSRTRCNFQFSLMLHKK